MEADGSTFGVEAAAKITGEVFSEGEISGSSVPERFRSSVRFIRSG